THGVMERCNLACTSCYLTDIANATRPLPFAEVRQQLDRLRRFLGPAGKAQITSGEVTLLPVEQLGRIVAYARAIGLDPMVMSNGVRFIESPGYLATLMRVYGLEKISIHIDTTQRGRKGLREGATEEEIHPIRERFAALIRDLRARTGRKLHAAHTLTVTRENYDQIPAIMRWVLDNADAFRMVSFQPTAEIGRTHNRRIDGLTLDAVWQKVCAGAGRSLNRHAVHFGHPECNILSTMLVASFGGRHEIIETVRRDNRWDLRMMRRILDEFGGFRARASGPIERAVRLISMLLQNPGFLLEAPLYGLYRLWGIRAWLPAALAHLLAFRAVRLRPLVVVVHKFMSRDELETPLGRERLQACSFKLPVNGKMVSMCEMNATPLRRELNHTLRLHRLIVATRGKGKDEIKLPARS
ncbi:MAG: radical SAM protein, partial [Acidobacteriota bacterium]